MQHRKKAKLINCKMLKNNAKLGNSNTEMHVC